VGSTCIGSVCVVSSCASGTSDCNGQAGDGCEYANAGFATDLSNCGGCNRPCAPAHASGSCQAGACKVAACANGYSDCNAAAADGCEYANTGFATDVSNCGACGSVCNPTNGTGSCAAAVCSVIACNTGHADCNGSASDGCEYVAAAFQTDMANCGGCGRACAPANATGVCAAGACAVLTCNPGHFDANRLAADGCEATSCTPTSTTDMNCDRSDDDCNGKADDGYVGASCGVGACGARALCINGVVGACVPGAPSAEGPFGDPTCSDGVDNDCDGSPDEYDTNCGGDGGAPPGDAGAGTDGGTTSEAGSTSDAGAGVDASGTGEDAGGVDSGVGATDGAAGEGGSDNATVGNEAGCACRTGVTAPRAADGTTLAGLGAAALLLARRRRQKKATDHEPSSV
jgi:MYXO-CTERM domain-containing protein